MSTTNFEKIVCGTLRYGVGDEKLSSIRKLCRENSDNVVKLAEILLENITKDDIRVRLNSVLIADDIFSKCHAFREKIIENLQVFLLSTIETDPLHYPIVGPKNDVKLLKSTALKTVYKWTNTYGKFYRKLQLAVDFLKTVKTVDLDRLEAETVVERQRKLLSIERQNNLRRKTTEEVEKELQENKIDIELCLKELENAFEILIPKNDNKSSFEPEELTNSKDTSDLSKHGFFHKRNDFNVEITLDHKILIEETNDNVDLLKNLKDSYKLLKFKYSPKIESFLKRLTKSGVLENELVKSLLDFRQRSNLLLKKFEELNLKEHNQSFRSFSLDEDDSDFITVEDVDIVQKNLHMLDSNLSIDRKESRKSSDSNDPSCPIEPNIIQQNSYDDCSKNEIEKGSTIPKLKFGIDFYDDDFSTSVVRNDSDSHRFWRPIADLDVGLMQKQADVLNRRKFTFQTDFKPVERQCGAIMADGTRCKRMDREKCPFHGEISQKTSIDEPSTSSAVSKPEVEKSWKDAAFSDPALINDIEAATGVKLTDTEKKKRKTKKQEKGQSTSRARLMTKFSNRSSLKRVNAVLDTADKKKFCDKFSHQWNYAVFN